MDTKFTKSDIKFLLLFYAFALPIALYDEDFSNGLLVPISNVLVYVIFSLSLLYLIVFKIFPKYFPKRQIFKLFVLITSTMLLMGIVEVHLYKYINDWNWNTNNLLKLAFYGLSSSLENTGILLGIFLGKKFYDAQIKIEKKEKERKVSELRRLSSQIDPHFLFNNLNTLDALIDSRPKEAKEYLHKLANLYRYLIQTKDHDMVTLDEELSFINDYIFLLTKRFGQAYKFLVNNNCRTNGLYIAPGALQTCLENVVKHNIASDNNPIVTNIDINEDELRVKNNIKLREVRDINGTGLENLKSRYQYLSDIAVEIEQNNSFTVRIPMLKISN